MQGMPSRWSNSWWAGEATARTSMGWRPRDEVPGFGHVARLAALNDEGRLRPSRFRYHERPAPCRRCDAVDGDGPVDDDANYADIARTTVARAAAHRDSRFMTLFDHLATSRSAGERHARWITRSRTLRSATRRPTAARAGRRAATVHPAGAGHGGAPPSTTAAVGTPIGTPATSPRSRSPKWVPAVHLVASCPTDILTVEPAEPLSETVL